MNTLITLSIQINSLTILLNCYIKIRMLVGTNITITNDTNRTNRTKRKNIYNLWKIYGKQKELFNYTIYKMINLSLSYFYLTLIIYHYIISIIKNILFNLTSYQFN